MTINPEVKTYTVHNEWTDGTFEDKSVAGAMTRKDALRIAKALAAALGEAPYTDVRRVLVCASDARTVAVFDVRGN